MNIEHFNLFSTGIEQGILNVEVACTNGFGPFAKTKEQKIPFSSFFWSAKRNKSACGNNCQRAS
jgi:hypothetical protein